jgi:hypothetical protein
LEKVYRDWSDFCKDKGNNEKVNEYFVEAAVDIQMCESAVLKAQSVITQQQRPETRSVALFQTASNRTHETWGLK